ncbi:MAG TPA: chemotaxis protein CheX [Polyangiaceae bacterium]|nr:chemotaxis protein CheX [Polyangiaceae bacterium]
MSNKPIFDELLVTCATELFRARGFELRRTSDLDTPIEYAAIIGFASDEVRGMLGLGMYPSTLERLASKHAGSAASLEDWLGECVNQLLGRLKNKLLSYDVVITLALPTVLRGVHLRFLATGPAGLWTYSFDSDGGPICVWCDVRHAEGLVLVPSSDPELKSTDEGELLLF